MKHSNMSVFTTATIKILFLTIFIGVSCVAGLNDDLNNVASSTNKTYFFRGNKRQLSIRRRVNIFRNNNEESAPKASPVSSTRSPSISCMSDVTGPFFEDGVRRTCEWVARKDTKLRCQREIIVEHCPETCGECRTSAPVPSQTDAPVPAPVQVPTSCLREDVTGPFFEDGVRRTCEWVARKDTKLRCKRDIISENCPQTCDVTCCDVSGPFFEDGARRTCEWVARKDTKLRCQRDIIVEHCPDTCGLCS